MIILLSVSQVSIDLFGFSFLLITSLYRDTSFLRIVCLCYELIPKARVRDIQEPQSIYIFLREFHRITLKLFKPFLHSVSVGLSLFYHMAEQSYQGIHIRWLVRKCCKLGKKTDKKYFNFVIAFMVVIKKFAHILFNLDYRERNTQRYLVSLGILIPFSIILTHHNSLHQHCQPKTIISFKQNTAKFQYFISILYSIL